MKHMIEKIKDNLKKINEKWHNFINKKYLKKIFLFLPQNIFLLILFIITIFLIVGFSKNHSISLYKQIESTGVYEGIVKNDFTYSLKNIPKDNISYNKQIDKICFTFATYAHKTNSIYNYKVIKNNETIYEKRFNSRILDDGKPYCFSLEGANKDNLGEYEVRFEPVNVTEHEMITIFKNNDTNEPTLELLSKDYFINDSLLVVIFILYIVISCGLNYFINKKKIKVEHMWLIFSLIYIIPILFLNPPYEVPDEPVHFFNGYRLTQFDKNKTINPDIVTPSDIGCLNYANIANRDKLINKEEVLNCFKNTSNSVFNNPYKVGHEISVLAPALGIKIGDLLTNSSGIIFYLGRLFATLFAIFIIYKALKIAPKHKEILLLVATLPMFIQQIASYSYDSCLNSFAILAISVILKMIYDKKVDMKRMTLLLLLSGMFITNIKYIYIFIFGILLLIPKETFKKTINKYAYIIFIIVSSFILGNLSIILFKAGNIINIITSILLIGALSIIMYLILEEKINKKWLILLGIFSILTLLLKPLYFAIIFVFMFFIPKELFKNNKHKIWLLIGISIVFLIALIIKMPSLMPPISNASVEVENREYKIAKEMKTNLLINNPLNVFKLAYNTFKIKGLDYLRGIVGYFGWFTYRIDDIYLYAYLFLAIYLICYTEFKIKKSSRVLTFVLTLLGIGAIFFALYIEFSDINLAYVDGVQGRYFLPFIPIILLLFANGKKKKVSKNITKNTYLFINMVLLSYICLLISFFY